MDKNQANTDKITQLQAKLATTQGRKLFKVWLRGILLVTILVLTMQLGLVYFWFQPSCEHWAQTLNKPVSSVDYRVPSQHSKHNNGTHSCVTGCCKVDFTDGSNQSVAFSNVSFWKSWTAILLNFEVDLVIAASLVYLLYLRRHGINFKSLFATK